MIQAKAETVIALCEGSPPTQGAIELAYTSFLTEQPLSLIVQESDESIEAPCKKMTLPIPSQDIHSARLISGSTWQKLKSGIIVISDEHTDYNLKLAELEPLSTEPTTTQPLLALPPINSTSPMLATWLWEPEIWQNPQPSLWLQLKDAEIKRVYVSISIDNSNNLPLKMEGLRAFTSQAYNRGIQVWAVEGDPHAILPLEREKNIRRADAYNTYNRMVSADERLAGIQYDIEPYLISGFDLAPEQGYKAYINTMQQLKGKLQLPINVVLPFWASTIEVAEKPLLEQLEIVDELTVMDYRTNLQEIQQCAEPFLNWGHRQDKPIHIALEAGPLPDQMQVVYRPATRGQIWHVTLEGQHILLLLKQDQINPYGESFLFSHRQKLKSDRLTFNNNIRKLIDLIPQLHRHLSQWPSYQGLSLHQYLEISRQKT